MLINTITRQDLTTQTALHLCRVAIDQAEQLGINICITIVCFR